MLASTTSATISWYRLLLASISPCDQWLCDVAIRRRGRGEGKERPNGQDMLEDDVQQKYSGVNQTTTNQPN